jgi:hypothetical protein
LIGLGKLAAFDSAPGARAAAPRTWPASTALARPSARPSLLFFAHPFCPCTSASITELEGIAALHGANAATITFVVYRPDSGSPWSFRSFSNSARYLPPHRFVWDNGATEARRFGVRTSGSVLVYSPEGSLLFEGGITGLRGHEGDNRALDKLIAILTRPPNALAAPSTAPVFGCALGSLSQTELKAAERAGL